MRLLDLNTISVVEMSFVLNEEVSVADNLVGVYFRSRNILNGGRNIHLAIADTLNCASEGFYFITATGRQIISQIVGRLIGIQRNGK